MTTILNWQLNFVKYGDLLNIPWWIKRWYIIEKKGFLFLVIRTVFHLSQFWQKLYGFPLFSWDGWVMRSMYSGTIFNSWLRRCGMCCALSEWGLKISVDLSLFWPCSWNPVRMYWTLSGLVFRSMCIQQTVIWLSFPCCNELWYFDQMYLFDEAAGFLFQSSLSARPRLLSAVFVYGQVGLPVLSQLLEAWIIFFLLSYKFISHWLN